MAAEPTSYASGLIQSLRANTASSPGQSGVVFLPNQANSAVPLRIDSPSFSRGLFNPGILNMPTISSATQADWENSLIGDDTTFNPGEQQQYDYLTIDDPADDPVTDDPVDDVVTQTTVDLEPIQQADVQDTSPLVHINTVRDQRDDDTEVPDYTDDIYPPSGQTAVEQIIVEGKKTNDGVVFEPDDQYVQLTLDELAPIIQNVPQIVSAPEEEPTIPDYIDDLPPPYVPQIEVVGQKPNDEVIFEPDDQYVQLTLDEVLPPIDSLPINVAPEQPAEQPVEEPVQQVVIEAPTQSAPEPVLAPEQVPDIAPEDFFVPPEPETVAIPDLPPIEVAAPPAEPPASLREVIEAAMDQAPPTEPVQAPVPLQEVIEPALDQAPPPEPYYTPAPAPEPVAEPAPPYTYEAPSLPMPAPEPAPTPLPDDGLLDAVSVAEAVGIPAAVAEQVGITQDTTVAPAPVEEPTYDPAMDVLYVPDLMLDMGGADIGAMDDLMMEDWA